MSNTILDNLVKCFNNSNLGVNLTTILIDNEPWFIAKEVASILGYDNTTQAINTHIDELDQKLLSYRDCKEIFKNVIDAETVGIDENLKELKNSSLKTPMSISNRGMKLINEAGLYTLVIKSDKPEAKPFQRWVTSEVLPSIRKTGSYGYQLTEHETLLFNILKAKSEEEKTLAIKKLDEYHERERKALEDKTKELEDQNKDLKRTKGQISTRREAVALAEASKTSRKNKKLKKELDIKSKELDKANVDKDILQTELELACSTMFTNKRVCEMIQERFNIKYANSTLKAKTSKALQSIANELGENIVYRKERVNDDDLHYVPYYTPRTYEVLTQRLGDDNKYLRQY